MKLLDERLERDLGRVKMERQFQELDVLYHEVLQGAAWLHERRGVHISVPFRDAAVCLDSRSDLDRAKSVLRDESARDYARTLQGIVPAGAVATLSDLLALEVVTRKADLQRYLEFKASIKGKGIFFEWLTLLMLCSLAAPGYAFGSGRFGDDDLPIEIWLNGNRYFFWYQERFRETRSSLSARPDFLITDSEEQADANNTVGIVECKAKKVGSSTLREFFAAAYDIQVMFALLFTLGKPSKRILLAGDCLGLDIMGVHSRTTGTVVIPEKKTRLLEVLQEGLRDAEQCPKFLRIARERGARFEQKATRANR